MRFLIALTLLGVALASPGYRSSVQGVGSGYNGASLGLGGGFQGGNIISTGGYSGGAALNAGYSAGGCANGQIQNVDGSCFGADVTKNVYVFESPKKQIIYGPAPIIPKGRVHQNVLYIKTPEIVGNNDPIIVPPSQTKTTLYVLSQNGQQGQRVVQYAEGQRTSPEVFYVHYNEGENPTLPNGLDLNTALSNAAAGLGQFVGGGRGSFNGGLVGGVNSGFGAGQSAGFGGSVGAGAGVAYGSGAGGAFGAGAGGAYGAGAGGAYGAGAGAGGAYGAGAGAGGAYSAGVGAGGSYGGDSLIVKGTGGAFQRGFGKQSLNY